MEQKVNAVLSDSEKYLIICRDTATDDANNSYVKRVKTLVQEFKK